jgi:hypothetical protein
MGTDNALAHCLTKKSQHKRAGTARWYNILISKDDLSDYGKKDPNQQLPQIKMPYLASKACTQRVLTRLNMSS